MSFEWWDKEKLTWLPTQAQLQEMILQQEGMTNCYILTKLFLDFVDKYRTERWLFEMLTSMKRLWLAFVMFKLYNKQWNADKQEWVDWRNECLVGFT